MAPDVDVILLLPEKRGVRVINHVEQSAWITVTQHDDPIMATNQGTDVHIHGIMHHRFGGKMSVDRLQKVRATVIVMKDQMLFFHKCFSRKAPIQG
jgi:hypothetical protein